MATTLKDKVTVLELSRYGFKREDGKYVGWSKNFKEADKVKVVPGGTYEMELYIADSGKQYVNSVGALIGEMVVPPKIAYVPAKQNGGTVLPTLHEAVKRDFDKEARGKTRCALFAAAVSSPYMASMSNMDDLLASAIRIADYGVKYTFGDDK